MRTLGDDILDVIAPVVGGVALKSIAAKVGEALQFVRAAAEKLDNAGRAVLIVRGRGGALILAPIPYATPVCRVCHREFERKRKSKRVTCSRSCHASIGWRDPAKKARRVAAIKAQRQTPQGKANSIARNKKRWSDPEQRERLRQQNKARWGDPVMKARMVAAIRNVRRQPEKRAQSSEIRKRHWADPKKCAKMIAGIKRSKSTPEARAKFSKLLKDRWADPVLRKKYLAAVRRTANLAKTRAATKARHAANREART